MIFFWEFSKLLESIIFGNFFICVEKLNHIKNYMKTRRETRKGGQNSLHFVLTNRTEHLYYTYITLILHLYYTYITLDIRSAKYKRFMKTFLKRDQDRRNWRFFCEKKNLFSSYDFFLFIMCLPRNSILYYASIIPTVLEEFRPVSV